jgi:hypothetical protein
VGESKNSRKEGGKRRWNREEWGSQPASGVPGGSQKGPTETSKWTPASAQEPVLLSSASLSWTLGPITV